MAAIKLDISKAYNRVEWSYLKAIMLRLGFNERWVSLIMKCISSAEFSILINGEKKGSFKANRGLRQGDPLSPYLFLLVAEGLSYLISQGNNLGHISGFVPMVQLYLIFYLQMIALLYVKQKKVNS